MFFGPTGCNDTAGNERNPPPSTGQTVAAQPGRGQPGVLAGSEPESRSAAGGPGPQDRDLGHCLKLELLNPGETSSFQCPTPSNRDRD